MGIPIAMTVNGKAVTANVDPRTLLVEFLRDNLGLTGTHVGCDTAQCGACTVHLDGTRDQGLQRCSRCRRRAPTVVTIEGLAAADGALHPMQAAFKECHGLQCGFCTPGMVMSAHRPRASAIPRPTRRRSASELDGNLCRCTGYHNIVKAVQQGAAAMAK